MLPTQRIRLKDGGTEMIINVSDFDPRLHEDVNAAPAAPEGDDTAAPVLTAAEIVAAAKTMTREGAQGAWDAEQAREGGARKTVLAALTARFDQLTAQG